MEFDKKNPFAVWYSEEVISENDTRKFKTMLSMEDSAFVNDGVVTDKAGIYNFNMRKTFFTCDDNTGESLLIRRRKVDGKDNTIDIPVNYNNSEVNYYGIQADDLYFSDTNCYASKDEKHDKKQKNNEIWYTTTNGEKNNWLDEYTNIAGDELQWVSNTYSNGKGIVTFNGDITEIKSAFYEDDYLESMTFPESVRSIGDEAFAGWCCRVLKTITIPKSIESIGNGCFYNCYSLETINYTGTVSEFNEVTKGDSWFEGISATSVHCSDGEFSLISADN